MFTNSKSLFQKFTKNCYVWRKETCYKSSFYSLNFFSLEFHLSLFYLFWCLLFFVRIHEATEGIFLVTFFCLVNLVTFLFVCFAKESSSQFLFFHFFVKKKEKKTMDLFFTFLLMIPSCKLCFDDFFSLFVRLFVCWFVVTPGKQ